jgi:predicted secreted protein
LSDQPLADETGETEPMKLSRTLTAALVAGLPILLWQSAFGQGTNPPAPRYNLVELQADAQREVPNDLLAATLFVEETNPNPAALAATLNRVMAEALKVARDFPQVKARSGNNATYPVYAPRTTQLQGWRGRAEMRLETRDFASGSALIGKLQAAMQLAGVGFSVSPEARKAAENELIAEAIAAFRGRAEIVQKAMAGKGFRIERLNVSTGQNSPPPRIMMAAARAQSDAAMAAPPVEAGASIVTVTVGGAVEVQ